ncbi:hypothetical protein J3A83DRAFT_4375745 [Scleroderma citrinum]
MAFYYYDYHSDTFHRYPPSVQDTNKLTIIPHDDATTTIVQPSQSPPCTAPTPEPVPPSPIDVDDLGGIDQSSPPDGVALWFDDGSNLFDMRTPCVVETGGDTHDDNQIQEGSFPGTDEHLDNYQQDQAYLPSPALTLDLGQPQDLDPPPVKIFPFTKPPHQDFIEEMIIRSRCDKEKYPDYFPDVDTKTVPPLSDISKIEEASHKYYETSPMDSPFREDGSHLAYHYLLEDIRNLQEKMRNWDLVMPPPIPIVILKPFDYVGPRSILQGENGWIFAIPNEDTIWSTVLERGVDAWFRPIACEQVGDCRRPAVVVTEPQQYGQTEYTPKSIVASKFAVNLFQELPGPPFLTLEEPSVVYLGSFLLQYDRDLIMSPSIWDSLADYVKDYVYDRAPHLFEGVKPFKNIPRLPLVKLLYIKFDNNLVGCADQVQVAEMLKTLRMVQHEREEKLIKSGEEDPGNVADEEDYCPSDDVSVFDSDEVSDPFTTFTTLRPP